MNEPVMVGYCDYFTLTVVRGWCVDPLNPDVPVAVRVVLDDEVLGTVETGEHRSDLPAAHSAAGFSFDVPPTLRRRVNDMRFLAGPDATELTRVKAVGNYQATGSGTTASDSSAKLHALQLPQSLAGLTFLDVGCNEGFFCDVALQRGARSAVGLDRSPDYVARGRELYPQVEFICGGWDEDLPAGPFDIILLASALHYAHDPRRLLVRLRDRLSPDGLLILEAGVAVRPQAVMTSVVRDGDIVKFPTYDFLRDVLLEGFAYREVGKSVPQQGDPVPRAVFHCRVKQPVALVVSGPTGVGKSTIGNMLRRQHRTVELDTVMWTMQRNGLLAEWPRVAAMVNDTSVGGLGAAYAEVLHEPSLLAIVLDELCTSGDGRGDLDVYLVPDLLDAPVREALASAGYLVWMCQADAPSHPA